jgi:hypothetical protein
MTSSVLANSKYLQGRLIALIDPTREANRKLPAGKPKPRSMLFLFSAAIYCAVFISWRSTVMSGYSA